MKTIRLTHVQAHQWIDRALEAALSPAQQQRLDAHLVACPSCQIYQQNSSYLDQQMRRAMPARWPETPVNSAQMKRALQAVRARSHRRSRDEALAFFGRLAVAGGVLLALVWVLGAVVQSWIGQPPVQSGGPLPAASAAVTLSPDAPTPPADLAALEQQVTAWIFANQPDMNPSAVFHLVEVTTPQLRAIDDGRVVKVASEIWQNEAFLLWNGQVFHLCSAFGDSGLDEMVVTDLNADGVSEVVYTCNFGSGIRSTTIGLFAFAKGEKPFEVALISGAKMNHLHLRQDDPQNVWVWNDVPDSSADPIGRLSFDNGALVLLEPTQADGTPSASAQDDLLRVAAPVGGLSFEVPSAWQMAIAEDGSQRYDGADGFLQVPGAPQSGDSLRACEVALNTNPGGVFGTQAYASIGPAAGRQVCWIGPRATGDADGGSPTDEAWLFVPLANANQFVTFVVDHSHLGLLVSSLAADGAAGLAAQTPEAVTLTVVPGGAAPQLEAHTLGDLTLEEWRVTAADIDTPSHDSFADHLPAEVWARRAAWREPSLAKRIAETNAGLAAFGAHLADDTGPDGLPNLSLLQGQQVVLQGVQQVYPLSVLVTQQGETDYALVVVDSQGQGWLVRAGSVTAYDLAAAQSTVPVFAGDRLISLDSYVGEDEQLRLVVRQDGEAIFTYHLIQRDSAGAVRGLWSWNGQWVLEVNGVLLVDGALWNQKDFQAEEIFNWQMLNGKPAFFFSRDGQTGLWYDGAALPLAYEAVLHNRGGEAARFNPAGNEAMLWFYARRAGYWYYVELGHFAP